MTCFVCQARSFRADDVFTRIGFVDLVVLPGGPHPIPFRTRSLSPPGPMVLRLKARESRSPPGLPRRYEILPKPFIHNPYNAIAAGWSSPVARQAHNLKVTGSNPVPATNLVLVIMKQPALWRAVSFALSSLLDRRAIHAPLDLRTMRRPVSRWRKAAGIMLDLRGR